MRTVVQAFLSILILAILAILATPFVAKAAGPSCIVASATGDIRYRRTGSLNWVPLDNRKELFVGDLLFTRTGASARIEYVAVGAAVELPPQTLFRIGEVPPTYTKLRRRFAVENAKSGSGSGSGSGVSNNPQNPFERVQVKNPDEGDGKKTSTKGTQRLSILREKSPLQLAAPQAGSVTFSSAFPAKLTLRVGPEFMGKKVWAFLWAASDKVNPIWNGYSLGEFSAIPIPAPGTYSVQAISDDETLVSETVSVEFRKQNNAAEHDELSDLLENLRDKRGSNYTITVE